MSNDRSAAGQGPAGDLEDVWTALDALPRASASIDMAATTIDLAAVSADRGRLADTLRRGVRLPASARSWLWPALAVAGSLVGGVVIGRATAPDPDLRVLESLPLIRHLGLLREAGSVKFLKSLAARRNQLPLRQPPGFLQDDAADFNAALAELEQDHALGSAARPRLDERREAMAALSADERDAVELAAAAFLDLPAAKRGDLAAVAAVLATPAQEELRAAARLWHLIIAASDPPDRKNIVDLDADERLEWLERRSRWRELMGERRGLPQGGEGLPPRGPGPGGAGAGEGRPRWQGPRGEAGLPGPRGDGGPQGSRGESGLPGPREGGSPGQRFNGRPRGEFGPRGDGGEGPPGPPGDRVGPRGDPPRARTQPLDQRDPGFRVGPPPEPPGSGRD